MAFTYAPGRSCQFAETILNGYEGVLQVDGYAGYNRLIAPDPTGHDKGRHIKLAYCWAHARRKLFEVAQNATAPIADEGLRQIASLYQIETHIRGQDPAARAAARQQRSKPLIAQFEV